MFQKLLTVQYLSTNNCFCCVSSNIRSLKPGSCLKLSYGDDKTAYVSLTSTTIKLNGDDCIGISSLFAKVQGIEDNAIVSATEIDQLLSISSISIVPIDRDSYEVLESFAENVQATLLDQVSVVSKDQNLVIWIGSNINAAAAIDDVQPVPLGRLNNLTEVIIKTPNDSNKKLQNNIDTNKVYNIKIQDFLTTLHDYHTILNKKILYNARPYNIESVYRLSYFNDLNSTFSKYFKPFNVFVTKSSLGIQRNSVNNILVGHLSLLTIDKLNSPTIYVRILFIEDIAELSHSEYCHSIFVNKIIFDHFSCDVGSRVVLKLLRKTSYVNEIQVFCKKNYLVDVENLFKTYLADNCCQGLVLNSEIWFDFHDNLKHYLKFGPNEAKFCVVDEDFVRNCKYTFFYENLPPVNKAMKEKCELDYFTNYSNVDEIVDCGVMVLYETSGFSWTDNLLIIGKQGTGKSTILNILKRKLNSYNIFTEVISCKYIKGKTSDSLMKLLSTIFAKLVLCQPSCLLLDDLHVVCENVKDELAQNNIYFNRISEMMNSYLNFLSRANKIHIVATAESLDKLHPQIYSSRGNHLFKNVYTISDLNKTARLLLLKHFFGKYSVSYIDFEDLSVKTEGFVIQDLVNFVNKAVFESCKDASNESEVINGDHCEKALKNTQVLSLHNVHLHDPGDKDFTNVGGLDNVKKILVESILWPVKYSYLFAEAPLRLQSGLLLYGPPGTGKTLIAGAAAKQCGLRLISIKGPELLSKYIGASEQGVRDIFYKAQSARPCILFFDEFDSLAPRRGHDNTGVTDRVVNQLLTQLDGIESLTGVCVVAATSRPDLLDPALLRPGRLDRQLLCSLPDINNRLDILTVLSKNMKFSEDADLKEVAANTDGYSGADLQSILYTAQMISVNLFSKDLVCNYDSSITNAHLAEAVSKTRPSLTAQEKAKYDRIYMQFQTGFNKDDFKLGFKTTLA